MEDDAWNRSFSTLCLMVVISAAVLFSFALVCMSVCAFF